MASVELLATLTTLKDEAVRKYRARIKGVFGSRARGDESPNSDVDVLVEFLEGATLFDFSGLGNFLEQELHCRVDVVSERALREEIKPYIYADLLEL